MPELPEVETTRRGIAPYLLNQTVTNVIVRQGQLRWPVPANLSEIIGSKIESVQRRAKYLLLETSAGTAILHLGMSGSLRVVDAGTPPEKHDHIDFILSNGKVLRLRDPRRFGAVLWTHQDPLKHKLLRSLGPEPLSDDFNVDYLYQKSRGRSVSIKQFIMNAHIVVGVGNIYACEALFRARISPLHKAGRVSKERYARLVDSIKAVLKEAIEAGGTTLRDFVQVAGNPGYFKQKLYVYGREGKPCLVCGTPIRKIKQGQRSTYYCVKCQR